VLLNKEADHFNIPIEEQPDWLILDLWPV